MGVEPSLLVWTDAGFLAAVDAAFVDAKRRGGAYLACRAGCNQCCTGTFAISMLDAARLRAGFAALPGDAAERMRARVVASQGRLAAEYPGDVATGLLAEDAEAKEQFEEFGNEEVCPVLDPLTGRCDLYAARPMTCRVFGPPVRTEEGLGVCELCYQGATAAEVEAGEMFLPEPEVEERLTAELGGGRTIVAFALPELAGGADSMLVG